VRSFWEEELSRNAAVVVNSAGGLELDDGDGNSVAVSRGEEETKQRPTARLGHANGCVSTRTEAALGGGGSPVKQANWEDADGYCS
jgi:hypothetical protein